MGCGASTARSSSPAPLASSAPTTSTAAPPLRRSRRSNRVPSAARSLSDSSIALVSSTGGGSSGAARPLQLPRPWRSSSRTWTPAQLARERAAFFDTRVTGRPETWAAVRLAVELARDEGDAPAAAEVLRAAGCTCPTGRMGEGVWDERGVLYVLPRWVGSDPVNVGEGAVDAAGMAAGGLGSVDEDEDVDDEGGSARHDVMAEKGTGMTVRARLSDRATDVVVDVNPTTSVRSLVRAVQAAGGVDATARIRIAYMGRILRDGESLVAQGWSEGHVVNALVFAGAGGEVG